MNDIDDRLVESEQRADDGTIGDGDVPSERPHVVCLSGSMRFERDIYDVGINESLKGYAVVLPLVNMKRQDPRWSGDNEQIKVMLDRLHFQKIDMADEVVVVCPGGYIGESTRAEIEYAESLGKPVRYEKADEEALPTEVEALFRAQMNLFDVMGLSGELSRPADTAMALVDVARVRMFQDAERGAAMNCSNGPLRNSVRELLAAYAALDSQLVVEKLTEIAAEAVRIREALDWQEGRSMQVALDNARGESE